MSAHTPGPWILATVRTSVGSCHKIGPFPNGDRAKTFACVYADGHRIGIDDANPASAELRANARLVAAAPELLEACQAMIEWDAREQDYAVDFNARMELCRIAFDKARAAIAKATGEQA